MINLVYFKIEESTAIDIVIITEPIGQIYRLERVSMAIVPIVRSQEKWSVSGLLSRMGVDLLRNLTPLRALRASLKTTSDL